LAAAGVTPTTGYIDLTMPNRHWNLDMTTEAATMTASRDVDATMR
jgi:hypothetical protein